MCIRSLILIMYNYNYIYLLDDENPDSKKNSINL